MARKKHKNRVYFLLASLMIAAAAILMTVLPQKTPPPRTPPVRSTLPSTHVSRPKARPSPEPGSGPEASRKSAPETPRSPLSTAPRDPSETREYPQGTARDDASRDSLSRDADSPDASAARRGAEPGGAAGREWERDDAASGSSKRARRRGPPARIAIIIDDVGYDSANVDRYLEFPGKLTFSVLPFLERTDTYARVLYEAGFEILIHVPMEPARYPAVDPGPRALLRGESRRTIEEKIRAMIEENPYAVGASNHMGSKATQDCDLMDWTMGVLRAENLFFVDSRTSPKSCAFERAREAGLPSVRRDVFLDNVDSVESIAGQFEKLKRIARASGTAVGIGHIHKKHTFEVLMREAPRLENESIALVFASEALDGRR